MAAPFERRELPEQGFFGRLFGRVNREGLLAEVEAALADAEDWAAVPRAAIAAIEANYGGTLLADARDETMALVCRAADALSPQQIVEGGVARLKALGAALGVGPEAEAVAHARAERALAEAAAILIADDELGEADRASFAAAAEACGFTPETVAPILAEAASARLKAEIEAAVADGLLTAEEEARIEALGQALGARLEIAPEMQETLRHARRLWQIEAGTPEPVASPIDLPRTEACLFAGYGQVLEPRTRGRKAFTHSYGAGDIVLTSKRLIFNGGDKNFAIRLNTIVSFEAFDDGVEVRRASGKPLTFALNLRDEWFARLFARVRRDAG